MKLTSTRSLKHLQSMSKLVRIDKLQHKQSAVQKGNCGKIQSPSSKPHSFISFFNVLLIFSVSNTLMVTAVENKKRKRSHAEKRQNKKKKQESENEESLSIEEQSKQNENSEQGKT